ncbi:HNH endonuclease signature motif containing protein [Cryobacterium sp. TMT1-2-2]|uniref:HNH endonuclease signature motif containing protein n=1 Tax=Cryobacterium sp. TMT1-2-2 TaxID=1259233 RepID=UPI00141B5343|nr:HNH endonuclease signature motif containing protein [Cryobacterium sp. TMT1-2-2]
MAPMFVENPSEASSNPVVVAVEQAREILLAALGGVSFGLLGDEESLTLLLAVESVGRVVDGARVLSTTDVLRRSQYFDAAAAKAAAQAAGDQSVAAAGSAGSHNAGSDNAAAQSVTPEGAAADAAAPSVAGAAATLAAPTLARRLGCRSGVELVCTLARLSRSEVRQRSALGEKAGQRMLLGRPLAPTYPVLGDALQGGGLGLEQARVIVQVLDGLRSEVLASDLDRVERSLVASGSGAITPETEGLPGAGIAFAPELLRQQGIQWKARLAPDGTAPGETPTERRSWLTFGTLSNGGYSLNGWFTTLDRAIVGNVFDAYLSAAAANPVPGAGGTATPASGTASGTASGAASGTSRVSDATPRALVAFRETEPEPDTTNDNDENGETEAGVDGAQMGIDGQNRQNNQNCDNEAAQEATSEARNATAAGQATEIGQAGEAGAKMEASDTLGADPPDPLSPDPHGPCPQHPDDTRSRSEKQAGILRAVFEAAARHPDTPTMGGAAPTVLVHININDLLDGRGAGWIDGIDGPLTPNQVDELICAGGYQPILFGHNGTILHLGASNRFFTASQRRALAARDGGCVIPGCTVPPHLTQVHHVVPWRQGGLTDIDNAVLICNAAHSSIDTSGWDIDMRDGRPWIRGPLLFDPTQTWRPAGQNRAATPAEKPNWDK